MKHKYVPEIVMLIAALITCIVTLVRHFSTLDALIALFFAMVSFYIIGLIARFVLNRLFDKGIVAKGEETVDHSPSPEEEISPETTSDMMSKK